MENNSLTEQSSNNEIKNSGIELATFMEQTSGGFVPKIRIRLRPQLVKSSGSTGSQDIVSHATINIPTCDKVELVQSNNESTITWNSDNRIYKTPEDSGGGGGDGGDVDNTDKQINHFMNHGINLRSRPQKLIKECQKSRVVNNNKMKLLTQSKNNEFIKTKLKPINNKGLYQTLMLKTPKCLDEIDKSTVNNKLSRKQLYKNRGETLFSNINLKDIINQDNFIKFPLDIQWQLVNLLPNCDKPKISTELDSCKCADYNYSSVDNCSNYPNLGFSVLNNEFLGKALAKFSLKMGQCDLINVFNSERENLRSRPSTILSDDGITKSSFENDVEVNKDQNVSGCHENKEILDEDKSHSSSTTTETVEMNGIENIEEKNSFERSNSLNTVSYENSKLVNLQSEEDPNGIGNSTEIEDKRSKLSTPTEGTVKTGKLKIENVDCTIHKSLTIKVNENSLSPSSQKGSVDLNNSKSLNSDFIDENRRKRGRKRKIFGSNDLQIIPIKRSNRSTAGKRPARLDSESPPTSPTNFNSTEKKPNFKCKKYKDPIHNNNKKHKLKYENCDHFDNLKFELKPTKRPDNSTEASKHLKVSPTSPDSLFSHTESDLSPLSKPSPNGNGLFNNFLRSNLVTSHINSVQTLSPSWSCTSESTTPSAKSDYGHNQLIKPNTHGSISVAEIQDTKVEIDSDTKHIQRMPPPRQTLTLAAMREKMRAKKLAKEDSRKMTNSNNRKSSTFLNNQRHKRQYCNAISKEDDDFKLMEKIINNSEDIDELLNDSQESLLDFFTGNNYDFDTTSEQGINLHSVNFKTNLQRKSNSKFPMTVKEKTSKISLMPNENLDNNLPEKNLHSNKTLSNDVKSQCERVTNPNPDNSLLNNQITKESPNVEKSFTDTISYVLQKLNLAKDNNGVLPQISPGKSSHPNAYLVDSNGLTTALSIIQSLNPGAKVTTQQFYLVNSGPQLILQPNPPLTIGAEKVTSTTPFGFQSKVSLAPKITNSSPTTNQLSNILKDHVTQSPNSYSGVSMSHVSYNPNLSEKSFVQTPEIALDCRSSSSLKMPSTDVKNTFIVSSITPTLSTNQPRNLHLQTISTPQPIGFVQPVQQSLPSLFPSQLRFMQPSLSNTSTSNTISFLTSNNATCNASLVNTGQQPKLLFLCPTIPNNSNLVTTPNVINQDQKYLLLSKQPDKQATIQLVSSQGLWQQLNPNIISQPNNVLVMQSQPINTVYESLLCPNTFLPSVSPINTDYSVSERKTSLSCDIPQTTTSCIFKEQQNKQIITSSECTSSSLIIDSRSYNNIGPQAESSIEINKNSRHIINEDSMTPSFPNHTSQSVNSVLSFFPTTPSIAAIINDNHLNPDENTSFFTDKFKKVAPNSDQPDVLQSSQDINLS